MAKLRLAETADGPFLDAAWIAPMVALGARVARFVSDPKRLAPGEQLVIALTLPARDLAAVLLGVGWTLTSPVATNEDPWTVLSSADYGTIVRLVTDSWIVCDTYSDLQGTADNFRARVGRSSWQSAHIRSVQVVERSSEGKMKCPTIPSLGPYSVDHPDSWYGFLCRPPANLMLVGAKSRLEHDLATFITNGDGPVSQLSEIILPKVEQCATWSTHIVSSVDVDDGLIVPKSVGLVVLDGAPAIKGIDYFQTPAVIALLDRRVIDDSAAELLVQRRNTQGEPLKLLSELGWEPPPGVETLAYKGWRDD